MQSKKNEKNETKSTEQLKDVATVELDNVTGGCAACGNAACCAGGAMNARRWR